jgi:DNA repair exonuclease SbcCD nuclease subunit
LHIDSPFKEVSSLQPELADKLRDSTFQAFENILNFALKENVDAVLIAGDIYDSAEKSLRAQLKFRRGLDKLSQAGIASFIIHGNHDPLNSWSASLKWPENTTIFTSNEVSGIPLIKNGKTLARIYGISFPEQNVQENLSLKFKRQSGDEFAIGLLHTNVGGNKNHGSYAPCSIDDLCSSGMDYWALGHIHAPQIMRSNDPAIVYSGNTQARHFNETGEKGCYLVTVPEQGLPNIEFHPMDAVRFRSETIDLTPLSSLDDLMAELRSMLEQCSADAKGRGLVLKIQLTGRTLLHKELQGSGTLDDLCEDLLQDFANRESWIWPEMTLDTQGTYDIDKLRQGEDFIADLIGFYDEVALGKHQSDLEPILKPLYENWQGRKFLDDLSEEDLQDLLIQARNLTLDELIAED